MVFDDKTLKEQIIFRRQKSALSEPCKNQYNILSDKLHAAYMQLSAVTVTCKMYEVVFKRI